jgi:histone deacetylase 1/2
MLTPLEKLFNQSPNYTKLKTFGCLCYPWLAPYAQNKLVPKSQPCIFLGYCPTQSAYLCFNPVTHKLYTSRHVQFVETIFPYLNLISSSTNSNSNTPTSFDHPTNVNPFQQTNPQNPPNILGQPPPISTPSSSSNLNSTNQLTIPLFTTPLSPPTSNSNTPTPISLSPNNTSQPTNNTNNTSHVPISPPHHPHTNSNLNNIPIQPLTDATNPPINAPSFIEKSAVATSLPNTLPHSHSMVTRSKNGIVKPKKLHTVSKFPLPITIEPSCPSKAIKIAEWKSAMSDEFNALLSNNTWSLVPPHSSQNVIGCKWVFRIKRNPDGSVARYKARLVAKGFHQQPGIDYTDTFSPVIKPQTIKMVICIALHHGWSLSHMDVNNAFLNGTISETIYMSQPYGFVHPQYPHHVCKLHKSLYGLKQAPRAWFQALQKFLLDYGFQNAKSDTSLFVYVQANVTAYFLVYVDDILLTGNDPTFLRQFQQALSNRFSLKNLGTPSHFLGVEFVPTKNGMFLSQQHYIRDLLESTNMHDSKPVSTPMSTSCSLIAPTDTPVCDVTAYQKIIGSLQYLSLTRPDISFCVNRLSQYLATPTSLHLQAAKRVLLYLKGTITQGLHLTRDKAFNLTAFCDADWAGDRTDYKSTATYIIYFGPNPISWSSKKQRTVAKSSTEAEYRTIASTTQELIWLQQLLTELHCPLPQKPTIYSDNLGATYLCANPVFHSRMKHLAIDYHFVCDLVQANKLQVLHIPTGSQLADLLTKPLSSSRHSSLTSKIGVVDPSTILRGRVEDKIT